MTLVNWSVAAFEHDYKKYDTDTWLLHPNIFDTREWILGLIRYLESLNDWNISESAHFPCEIDLVVLKHACFYLTFVI